MPWLLGIALTSCGYGHQGCEQYCDGDDDCVSEHACMPLYGVLRCLPEVCRHCAPEATCLFEQASDRDGPWEYEKKCSEAKCTSYYYPPGSPMPSK